MTDAEAVSHTSEMFASGCLYASRNEVKRIRYCVGGGTSERTRAGLNKRGQSGCHSEVELVV